MPISTKVVSSNPANGEVYSIQHYVIKFVSGPAADRFSPVSSINKTDCHKITEILLKVVLNICMILVRVFVLVLRVI
jgi:hypothetical protein